MNVSILHLKAEFGARHESRFTCYPDCCITWCPLLVKRGTWSSLLKSSQLLLLLVPSLTTKYSSVEYNVDNTLDITLMMTLLLDHQYLKQLYSSRKLYVKVHVGLQEFFKFVKSPCWLSTLRPRPSCHHFADDIFNCISLNENMLISLKISQKFVLKVRINNIPALVRIMAWHRPEDKPLFE